MGYQICSNRYYVENSADFYEQLSDFLKDKTNVGERLTSAPTHYPCEVYFEETDAKINIICNYDKQTWARSNLLNEILGFLLNYRGYDIQFITTNSVGIRHGCIMTTSSNYWALLKFKLANLFKRTTVNEHTLAQLAPCFENVDIQLLKNYEGAEILITEELILGEHLC